jgi:hypothetical protein
LRSAGRRCFTALDQIGQRRFGVGRDGEINLLEALEILVFRFDVEGGGANADELGARPDDGVGITLDIVVEGVRRSPEILQLESEDHVALGEHRPGAIALVERMAAGKIHASAKIDHGALQRFGKLDQVIDAGLAAGAA